MVTVVEHCIQGELDCIHGELDCIQGVQCYTLYTQLLGHVGEQVHVVLVPPHVLVFYQPLDLLLDQFLAGQEHVLEDVHQLGLQLRVTDPLPHLEYLDNCLLKKHSVMEKKEEEEGGEGAGGEEAE